MEKNLVMGAAYGYTYEQIRPFIESLKETTFKGDICFILSPELKFDVTILTDQGIKFVYAEQFSDLIPNRIIHRRYSKVLYPLHYFIPRVMELLVSKRDKKDRLLGKFLRGFSSIPLSRYFYYYKFLIENTHYEKVLLTDVRDVVFQKDPFSDLGSVKLGFAKENPSYTIASEQVNRKWLTKLYGISFVQQYKNYPVFCSGTTIGSYESIIDYLSLMIKYQAKIIYKVQSHFNYDQAVHNYLIITKRIKDYISLEPFNSNILTMVLFKTEDITINEKEEVVNKDGSVISILHQYDWHPDLTLKVLKRA